MQLEQTRLNLKNYLPIVQVHENGDIFISSSGELGSYSRSITDWLEYWASEAPDRIFVAQRGKDNKWEKLNYLQALTKVRSVAQFLCSKKLSAERPLVILSGNSIEHLIVSMAAMYIGVPYSPISTAYSLIDKSYGKLSGIFELLTPGMVFVDSVEDYRGAIDAVVPADCEVLSVNFRSEFYSNERVLLSYESAINTTPTDEVDEVNSMVNGDTIAKFLFTSGSTGLPKAVINTQKMLCANQKMISSVLAFLRDEPPTLVDWLPWSHTFGGNFTFGIAIYNGGTFFIDHGKPTSELFETSLRNLQVISPTVYFNVPKAFEFLVRELTSRPEFAKVFFSKIKIMYYAAASLSPKVWDKLEELAIIYTGVKIPILSGLGSTETAPAAFVSSVAESPSGVIGLPLPGVEVKLIPDSGKLGAWVKGVNVTPGYWRSPDQTKKAFDADGFYCLGDALKFVDSENPHLGLVFDGRVSEDFKLDTGTWVSVSTLRQQMISHFSPLIQDVVITGRDLSYIGALVFPDLTNCKKLVVDYQGLTDEEILTHPNVQHQFTSLLRSMTESGAGSSRVVRRILLLLQPPRLDMNEITDKGSINQSAVIQNRCAEFSELYSEPVALRVISI